MPDSVFAVGSRVCVTSDGPLGGLRGIISIIYPIMVESEQPGYFYLVKLEGAESDELIWLAQDEVAGVVSLS